jgi:hypothetical protein
MELQCHPFEADSTTIPTTDLHEHVFTREVSIIQIGPQEARTCW